MKHKKLIRSFLSAAFLASIIAPSSASAKEIDQEAGLAMTAHKGKLVNLPVRNEAFMDWGLGMFVHWSIDAQIGSVISHSMVGASDDYLNRYVNELPQTFNPTDYNPDRWMEIAKIAGVKYMVFTTKHHNGYCMWDTETTEFNIMNSAYGKDIVKMYVEAARRAGIKIGYYFSPEDFWFQRDFGVEVRRVGGTGEERKALSEHNKRQLDELFNNYGDIDLIFFDGGDKRGLTQYVHQNWPEVIVTRGEMETPEQKLPKEPMPGPWESCYTLGSQWQFKPTNEEYKDGSKLISMLIETRAKGGNLLLNVGPDPYGEIPFEQDRIFREMGLWMFINKEAIHDIRPFETAGDQNMRFTMSKDGKSVYVFLLEHTGKKRFKRGERREILIPELKATSSTAISVLGQNDRVIEYNPKADVKSKFKQTSDGLEVSVIRAQRIYNNNSWPNTVVVKLENVDFVQPQLATPVVMPVEDIK